MPYLLFKQELVKGFNDLVADLDRLSALNEEERKKEVTVVSNKHALGDTLDSMEW